jgi:hypothetical protein
MAVTILKVSLPHKRGLIKVTSRAVNAVPGAVSQLISTAASLNAELQLSVTRISPCSDALNRALHARIQSASQAGSPLLTVQRRNEMRTALAEVARAQLALQICTSEAHDTGDVQAKAAAVSTVIGRYISLLGPADGSAVATTTEMRTAPSQRFSVGLVGGAMISRSGDTNYAVIDKALYEQPISGIVTAVVVHVHPVPFDPGQPGINGGERLSFFAGITTTPSAGFTGGITLRFYRGLGVQMSYAWLRANRLKPKYTAGDTAPVGVDPFRLGFTNALTFGISYEMK